jgi:hypothetical protein
MCMRYFRLAILATTAASALFQSEPESTDMARQLGDLDWAIQPEDGFPQIAFNSSSDDSEVVFKYNFTGIISDSKFFEINLYMNDCITDAGALSLSFAKSTNGDELDIDVDIKQETISTSPYYQSINDQAAIIGFCLRVDYNRVIDGVTESVNFYETNVTINVDLTANFTLTEIIANRTAGDNMVANGLLDCAVTPYICLDDNSEVADPDPLYQGDILQVCIKRDMRIDHPFVLVQDILTFVISQPTTETSNSVIITDRVSNALTEKFCREGGICNVKTQLQSKWFTDANPPDLRVDGVAVMGFGRASLMPSSAPSESGRRLRVPFQGLLTGDDVKAFMAAQQQRQQDSNEATTISVVTDSSQRRLDDGDDGVDDSDFGLQVGLQGINDDSSSQNSSQNIVVAVNVLIMLAAVCGLGFFVYTKRRTRKEEIVVDKHRHHSSAASVGTYPSQGSAYTSSFSGQYANYPSQGSAYTSSAGHATIAPHFD